MPAKTDVVQGAIKLMGLLEEECLTSGLDLIRALPRLLAVEVPSGISNVVVSAEQPGDDQRQALWVRLTNAGGFLGMYVYGAGNWQLITPLPSELVKVFGDSTNPATFPKGYILATDSVSLTASQKTFLTGFWHWKNDDPTTGVYDIFEVIFQGF